MGVLVSLFYLTQVDLYGKGSNLGQVEGAETFIWQIVSSNEPHYCTSQTFNQILHDWDSK